MENKMFKVVFSTRFNMWHVVPVYGFETGASFSDANAQARVLNNRDARSNNDY